MLVGEDVGLPVEVLDVVEDVEIMDVEAERLAVDEVVDEDAREVDIAEALFT